MRVSKDYIESLDESIFFSQLSAYPEGDDVLTSYGVPEECCETFKTLLQADDSADFKSASIEETVHAIKTLVSCASVVDTLSALYDKTFMDSYSSLSSKMMAKAMPRCRVL